jgi:GTPase SAR1 family protein
MASAAPASGAAAAARARPKPVLKDSLRLKVISMGDGGVGKTCIIKRYCEEKVCTPPVVVLPRVNVARLVIRWVWKGLFSSHLVSAFISTFWLDQFQPKYISTIGVDFGVKPETVGGRECKINFWDLSGHPEFFEGMRVSATRSCAPTAKSCVDASSANII